VIILDILNVQETKKQFLEMDINRFFETYIISDKIWLFEHMKVNDYHCILKDCFQQSNFDIDAKIYITGSSKIGFSTAPKKNLRNFVHPTDNSGRKISDIDIAIISEKDYLKIWEDIKINKYKTHLNNFNKISSSFFNGHISNYHLDNQNFPLPVNHLSLFDDLSMFIRDNIEIISPINYRIYYSFDDFKRYSHNSMRKIKGV